MKMIGLYCHWNSLRWGQCCLPLSFLCPTAIPPRKDSAAPSPATAAPEERPGPGGAEGGLPRPCPHASLPSPPGSDAPQRLGKTFSTLPSPAWCRQCQPAHFQLYSWKEQRRGGGKLGSIQAACLEDCRTQCSGNGGCGCHGNCVGHSEAESQWGGALCWRALFKGPCPLSL